MNDPHHAGELEKGIELAEKLRREGEALVAIANALKGLTPEKQRRVIEAVAVLHGFAVGVFKPEGGR